LGKDRCPGKVAFAGHPTTLPGAGEPSR